MGQAKGGFRSSSFSLFGGGGTLSPKVTSPRFRSLLLWQQIVFPVAALLFIALLAFRHGASKQAECGWAGFPGVEGIAPRLQKAPSPVLVSYSYFEKDEVQRANMEFFVKVGMGYAGSAVRPLADTDFLIVVSGDVCTPCEALLPRAPIPQDVSHTGELRAAFMGPKLTLLYRKENVGMDFAAHNVSIEWTRQHKSYSKYKYFIFLNSSVRGPFFPSYMPVGWQWTQAYTSRFRGDVAAVSSSIVCLPEEDAGGYGAHLESWAFALTRASLELLTGAGVFDLRTCKLCDDGVVVGGEYGITEVLMRKHGYNIATLMSMYPEDTDWRDPRHWNCNNNVHPSRHGTYDGIAMHPFEVVFLKTSWHVGEPFVGRYSKWFSMQAAGEDTTAGTFDEQMYRYAIQPAAQEPRDVEACYKVI